MSAITLPASDSQSIAQRIVSLVEHDGTQGCPYADRLKQNAVPMRDLSDALHIASMLHARYPGVIDHARSGGQAEPVGDWLARAAAAFAEERQWLAALVAATGPLPSTPGHAESESAVLAQCHALDTLAQSDRVGCAAGAAVALALDWRAMRQVLDHAGERLGLEPRPGYLPDLAATALAIAPLAARPATERAALFGAQQLLLQQRGMWNLLEARAAARDALIG